MNALDLDAIVDGITSLKREKQAVILAHYYQGHAIQDVADFVGDSLALAQEVRKLQAPIIVVCGVRFMAETVKLLCPDSKVLIPDDTMGCALADSCTYDQLKTFKSEHPEALIVSYINTTAAVKTLTDITVTSSNAVKIVRSLPKEQTIFFGPDENLGHYVQKRAKRKLLLWNGMCPVHAEVNVAEIVLTKRKYPDAIVLAHPECSPYVTDLADVVGSTKELIEYVKKYPDRRYMIGTEPGVIHQMLRYNPYLQVMPLTVRCHEMRKCIPMKLYECLRDEKYEITLDPETMSKAIVPIERMLNFK